MKDPFNGASLEAPDAYEAPSVVDYGTLQEVTAGASSGTLTDAVFPAGTDPNSFTFT